MENFLRLQINGICLAVIAILWISGERRKFSSPDLSTRVYGALMASTGAMLLFDALIWLFDGRPGAAARTAVYAFSVFYYVVHSLPALAYIVYVDFQIFRDEQRLRRVVRPLTFIAAAVAAAAISSPFTDILFVVDAGNHYHRGSGFPVFAVLQYALVGYALALIAFNAKKLGRRVFLTLLAYPLPMLAAAVAQMLVFGLVLIWPTTTLFLVASSLNIENHRSKTDYLTGTANRRSLDEELERRIAANRPGSFLCGLMIDLDHFKSINDRFGHEAGDRALEDAARILQGSVRVEDMVARFGGDEFVVLADSRASVALEELVERIERAVEAHNASTRRPYRLSLSIGRAVFGHGTGRSSADFLAVLDADMYARKNLKKLAAAGRGAPS